MIISDYNIIKMNKRGKSVIAVGMILLSLIIISSYYVYSSSANEISKSYNSGTKTVSLSNSLNGNIASISLIDNSEKCMTNCYAIMKIELKEDISISNLLSNLEFQKFTKNGFIDEDLSNKIYINDGYETKLVYDYQENCINKEENNGSISKICSQEIIGNHSMSILKWKEYNSESKDQKGIYYIKIEGKKGVYDNIEWIPTINILNQNIKLSEFASWNSSFEDNLQAYWKFNETSGTTAVDSIGRKNMTMPNVGWNETSKIYYSFRPDASSSLANTNINPNNFTKGLSISMWIYGETTDRVKGDCHQIGTSDGTPETGQFYLDTASPSNKWYTLWMSADGQKSLPYPTDFGSLGKWIHFVWTINSSSEIIYINGTAIYQSNYSNSGFSNGNIQMFGYTDGAKYCNGNLWDELAIYSRTLNPNEVSDLYNDRDGLTYGPIPPDTIAPETTTPIITPAQPTSSNNLECYATLTDDKQTDLIAYWEWHKNGELYLSGENYVTNGTYSLVTSLNSGNTTKGENWSCDLKPFDGYNNGTSKASVNITILNIAPTQTTPVLSTPSQNHPSTENLTCNNQSTSDFDEDNVINIYNWIKNEVSILSLNVPFEINANDYSGNGNDGTNNGAVFISGKLGNSLEFDGDNISFSDDDSLDFTNEKTWEIWVKRDNPGAETIFDKGNGSKSNYKMEFLSDDKLKFSYSLIIGDLISLWNINDETDFNEGNYNDTYYNTTINGVKLINGETSGSYISKVFDTNSNAEWNNITWGDNIGAVLTLVDINEGVYKSTDQGSNWILVNESYGGLGSAIEIIESINGILYIVNNREEIWKSEDFGKSWTEQIIDFNGAETTTAMTMTGDANYIYIIEDDEDVWRSNNSGVNWAKINDDLDSGTSTANINGIIVDSSGVIFAVANDAKMYKSVNYGINWTKINDDYNGALGNSATDLSIDYNNNLFILNMQEIWRSTDSGLTYSRINSDFNGIDSNNGITMTSDINRFLYVVDTSEDVYRSTNDGETWSLLISNVNGADGDVMSIVAYDQPTTKFQVRSCDDSICSGESFIGSDETDSSYYLSSPYNLNISDNQYFQYIAYFSTYDLDYSPQLYAVNITYTTQSTELEASLSSVATITDNNWHYIAVSFDNANENNFKIYIDGSLDANTTEVKTPGFKDNNLILGNGFNGILDEFKIYNIALTPEQINANYNLMYNTWVAQETSASEKYKCSTTPNDGENDGIKLTSNELEILVSITFNVTDSYYQTGLNNILINCDYPEFDQGGDTTNLYGPYGFTPGNWECEFETPLGTHFEKIINFTAESDKTVNVFISESGFLSEEEHTWLEAIYNCLYSGDCSLYNLLLEINQTTGNIWENTKPTDSNVVLFENITNKIVDINNNLTIDYNINIPIKAGYTLGTYLPIRIGFWFLDGNNETCYNQGDKPTGVEDPYCQPLVIETIGPMGGSTSFTIKLQPSLPVGDYNLKRIIDIDPNNVWINYGQETVGMFRVTESLNSPNINLQKTEDTMPVIQTTTSTTSSSSNSNSDSSSSTSKSITNVYNTYNTIEQKQQAPSEDGIIYLNKPSITGNAIESGLILKDGSIMMITILCGMFILFIIIKYKIIKYKIIKYKIIKLKK